MLCNETVPKQLKTSVGRMSVISRKEFEDILTQKAFPLSRPRQEDCGLNYGVVCCGSAGQSRITFEVAKVRLPESAQHFTTRRYVPDSVCLAVSDGPSFTCASTACSGSSGDFFLDNERLLCCRAEATQ